MKLKLRTLSLSPDWTIEKRWGGVARDKKVIILNKGVKFMKKNKSLYSQ